MASDEILTLTVQDAEAETYTGEIAWKTSSEDLTVNENGQVTFTGTMIEPLQEYIVTAVLNGEEKATATVYVYNPETYADICSVKSEST